MKRIILTTTLLDPEHLEQLKRYGLPLRNTIKNICTRDDVRFLLAPKSWSGIFFDQRYSAVAAMVAFLDAEHDLDAGAVDVTGLKTRELAVFKISPLNDEERRLRREYAALQAGNFRVKNNISSIDIAVSALLTSYSKNYDHDPDNLAVSLEKVFSFMNPQNQ